jgi:hypothetical protein
MGKPIVQRKLLQSLEDVMRKSRHAEGMTMKELRQVTGHREEWLRDRLMKLLEAGKLEPGRALRPAIDGTMRPIPVYKLKTT